ncbi:LacI family DNA-binding transcriptional regulator [Brooklawnia cerclae]|uniref:LacI family transcriptional regulator n=1 Tax=Brooklawnia cerclae TaxID=349934 RepID=A0ABX0SHL8_9ACTN|nr:LacI family DNA-binding transcriptional regulator [Brooklawnia cerclae]NIH57903.1 LacI family transcriptional regulator [Brooklawnia cerclae]
MSPTEDAASSMVTLADIAARAGVSMSTVSRALNRPGMLPAATEKHIRRIAAELGYRPNRAARALSTGQSDLVLVVVPDIANPFFPRLLRAAQRTLIDAGLYGVLVDTSDSPETETRLIREVARNTHGIINMSSRLVADDLIALSKEQPLALINREVPGVPGILLDAEAGIQAGLERLVDLGHRRFAYVRGPAVSWSNRRREEAVRGYLARDTTLGLVTVDPGDSTFDGGVLAAESVAVSGVTAVQVFDDVMAQGVIHGLLTLGLRIPEDISVLGCDGTLAPSIRGTLATVALDYEEAGALAARTLIQLRRGVEVPQPHIRVPGSFLPGTTIVQAPSPQEVTGVDSRADVPAGADSPLAATDR